MELASAIAERTREAIAERTREALADGRLQPIRTECVVVPDGGIPFAVRRLQDLGRREQERRQALTAARAGQPRPGRNPFEPPYDLHVTDLSDSHVCLLNKYPVVSHHVLVVTRRFEPQERPLGLEDCRALALGLQAFDALGFYNAGPEAGASQPHKHLQLLPVPLGSGPERMPVEAVLRESGDGLPFRHAARRLGEGEHADGEALLARWREGLRTVGLDPHAEPLAPHNWVVTRDWSLVVPRSRDTSRGISVNALGFAGALLVRDPESLARARRVGPLTVLREVTLA